MCCLQRNFATRGYFTTAVKLLTREGNLIESIDFTAFSFQFCIYSHWDVKCSAWATITMYNQDLSRYEQVHWITSMVVWWFRLEVLIPLISSVPNMLIALRSSFLLSPLRYRFGICFYVVTFYRTITNQTYSNDGEREAMLFLTPRMLYGVISCESMIKI